MQCIGATTLDEHRKHVEKDKALARRFQPVMVAEPSMVRTLMLVMLVMMLMVMAMAMVCCLQEDAVKILLGLKARYEAHHKCRISDEAVMSAVELSARYIPDRFLPDKAIDLMDEAGSKARMNAFRQHKAQQSSVLERGASEYWKEILAVHQAQEAVRIGGGWVERKKEQSGGRQDGGVRMERVGYGMDGRGWEGQ